MAAFKYYNKQVLFQTESDKIFNGRVIQILDNTTVVVLSYLKEESEDISTADIFKVIINTYDIFYVGVINSNRDTIFDEWRKDAKNG